MSYCRISDDSDVYVWASAEHVFITTSWDKTVTRGGKRVQDFAVNGKMQAVTVLLGLRREGLRVPDRAINRLVKEARA